MLTEVTLSDIQPIALGAGILGTGGGGSPRIGRLRLRSILEDEAYPDRVAVRRLDEIGDADTVTSVGGIGAPTISNEKLAAGFEEHRSVEAIERASGEEIDALIPGEIGGANSMTPLIVGALSERPVLDADGMGRAFPEIQMCTFCIYGAEMNYAALTDERGNQVVYQNLDSPTRLENLARAATVEFGGRGGMAFPLMDGSHVRQSSIRGTITLAYEIGEAVLAARRDGRDPVEAVCSMTGGREFFDGKIVDVFRRNEGGFARGHVDLEGLNDDSRLRVEFQNEFLVARQDGEVIATVPDLICLVDRVTGVPITTEALAYGQRVRVLGLPAPDLLTTDRALDVIGPRAFGIDQDYLPLSSA